MTLRQAQCGDAQRSTELRQAQLPRSRRSPNRAQSNAAKRRSQPQFIKPKYLDQRRQILDVLFLRLAIALSELYRQISDQPETCQLPSRVPDSVKLRDGLSYQSGNGNRAKNKSLPP